MSTRYRDYSIFDRVRDGPFLLTRLAHHGLKLATHAAVSAGLWLLFHRVGLSAIGASIVGGPVLWLALVFRERKWPTDRQPLAWWEHVTDWITDCALSCGALAVVLWVTHQWLAAAILTVMIIRDWALCHRGARP